MKFNEAKLEQAILDLLGAEGYPHILGSAIDRTKEEVLIKADLVAFLQKKYASEGITDGEIQQIVRKLQVLPASDLYDSNKAIMKWVCDGFILKREDRSKKDLFIQLLDYSSLNRVSYQTTQLKQAAEPTESYQTQDANIYKLVNQLEIEGAEKRIPDAILYVNGLPLVVFEFKTATNENTTIYDAYDQLTNRYRRDIPELFKYNAFCVISDGVNTKAGSFFAKYDFYYAWRKISGTDNEVDGIDALHSLIRGMFHKPRLLDIIHNFIYIPDTSHREDKILCRYPQYYAATKLYENVVAHQKPMGDGKGGTYFGATGCGKSFTMLFLSRLLMKSVHFSSPTLVIITDRTDLDEQLSKQFTNAKEYIGDQYVKSVESRAELRQELAGRPSGGVFLTTIHKFTEDTELLSERTNVVCISDEAHRSQINLDQKVKITAEGVSRSYGFAKYLHDSLPNATYVGFTGTPVDATLDVFGEIVDSYTMTESVKDEITVPLVYEGRAAKVALSNSELDKIEEYYRQCEELGANEHQIEESKKATANMNVILGDPDRIAALAKDFVSHYETRIEEGASVKGKAMFVCSSRQIAYLFFQEVIKLRPKWNEVLAAEEGSALSEREQKEIKPMERIKMIMTRGKDDPEALYNLLGNKDYRKELDRQFKTAKSNFKIAVVVDMWLTGFDVPFLDTIYIDKPLQKHSLIQTISRVNRKFSGKEKGLVVDYIGIKKQMNLALAQYSKADKQNIEDIEQSVVVVKDHLDLLAKMFHQFDASLYFSGSPVEQLNCLNMAAEFAMQTQNREKRFMNLVKRLKAAYDICSGSDQLDQKQKDTTHFYIAVRSIVFKLTKGDAPDISQMNRKVREMIKDALSSEGVEEIFKMGEGDTSEQEIFSDDYLAKIEKIKLPNTKIKILQQLLAKAIDAFKRTNKAKGVDFSKKMQFLVERYNERREDDVLVSNVLEDFTDQMMAMIEEMREAYRAHENLGIDFEEKAFYDILKAISVKYDFPYPDEKLIPLSQQVKAIVDDKAKYTDWSVRSDIKAELRADLVVLLATNGYPPITHDEAYKDIFEQAENFKKNRLS